MSSTRSGLQRYPVSERNHALLDEWIAQGVEFRRRKGWVTYTPIAKEHVCTQYGSILGARCTRSSDEFTTFLAIGELKKMDRRVPYREVQWS